MVVGLLVENSVYSAMPCEPLTGPVENGQRSRDSTTSGSRFEQLSQLLDGQIDLARTGQQGGVPNRIAVSLSGRSFKTLSTSGQGLGRFLGLLIDQSSQQENAGLSGSRLWPAPACATPPSKLPCRAWMRDSWTKETPTAAVTAATGPCRRAPHRSVYSPPTGGLGIQDDHILVIPALCRIEIIEGLLMLFLAGKKSSPHPQRHRITGES